MWQLPLLAALACRADSSNSSSRAGDTPLADDWGIQCTPAVVLAAKESVPVFQCGDKVRVDEGGRARPPSTIIGCHPA
jgi:hypothetical protein